MSPTPAPWPDRIHQAFLDAGVDLVSYVPDAGHKRLIELCQDGPELRAVPLTTEEEGVGLAMGAWLGGTKCVLLLQSSGVGNLVNVLGGLKECGFPLVMLVTMRGQGGEFNPWQVPMGRAVPEVLEAMGVRVFRGEDADGVVEAVVDALDRAYLNHEAIAVLISQAFIGIKSFQEQRDR